MKDIGALLELARKWWLSVPHELPLHLLQELVRKVAVNLPFSAQK
jgi:hypothetical protein